MSDLTNEILVVAGQTRCGSSLTMQMLAAAGVPTIGSFPDFEDDRIFNAGYYSHFAGHAVKLLDPQNGYAPTGHSYRWIWLDRDPVQQAKSMVKFLKWQGLRLKPGAERAFADSFVHDRPNAMKVIERLGGPLLTLEFEDIISRPLDMALAIADFTGIATKNVERMAAVVRPRTPDCLPYMLEETLIAEVSQ